MVVSFGVSEDIYPGQSLLRRRRRSYSNAWKRGEKISSVLLKEASSVSEESLSAFDEVGPMRDGRC